MLSYSDATGDLLAEHLAIESAFLAVGHLYGSLPPLLGLVAVAAG